MLRDLRARWAFRATLVLVAAFLGAFAGEFVHTDDGCQVEIHCLACQRVLGSVGTGTVAPHWTPSIELLGRVALGDRNVTDAIDSPPAASRAPPLA